MVKGILNGLIDIIYPPRCPICHEFLSEDRWSKGVCDECASGFHDLRPPFCPICAIPFQGAGPNHLCESCLKKRPCFDSIFSPFLYEDAVKEAIHSLKYGGKTSIVDLFGPILGRFAAKEVGKGDFVVVPVPLHPRKLRKRGFNQSLLLARHVAKALDSGMDYLSLERVVYTESQARLGKKDRKKNVIEAFHVKDESAFMGKRVILVDDVATTTNTLDACARALKRAGAREVRGIVLARTGSSS